MTTILFANIGTRDVQLDDPSVLPADVCDTRGVPVARQAGAYLRQKEVYAVHKSAIKMPMIEKALQYIAPQSKADVQIVLFATDQPDTVREQFRRNDTLLYAELIRDMLFERYERAGLHKKHIRVVKTAANPADYDLMYDFYQSELPKIAQQIDNSSQVYLLIAGGTPQMNTMLMFIGSEIFGGHAQPIYVSPDRDRATTLDILRQLYAQSLRRNLGVLLSAYAYDPALKLLEQEESVLEPWQVGVLAAVFRYALARRNLDLPRAARALDQAVPGTRAVREDLRALQQDVASESEQIKLRETIYLAHVARETGDWADFLARLHRFSEGTMQLLAERLRVRWSDPEKRSSYHPKWWDEQRAMLHTLGLAEANRPDEPKAENTQREVNRKNLRLIIEHLAQEAGHADILAALDALQSVDAPIPLRNDIVHRFTPISIEEVESKAGRSVDEILAQMRSAYGAAFGVPVPVSSPYQFINELCQRVLGGER